MGFLKLAAGVAVGYVLGSRAGREKYENIAATARKVGEHPTVVQAQEKAKALIGTGTDKVNAKLSEAAASASPSAKPSSSSTSTSSSTAKPSPSAKRSTSSATSSTQPTAEFGIATEPLR